MLDFYSFNTMETKKCGKCGEVKPISEFFKHKNTKDRMFPQCKCCMKKIKEEYRKKHPEKTKEYRKKHQKEIKEYRKEYRKKHPEKTKESQKEYRKKYQKKLKEYQEECRKNLHPSYVKKELKRLGYTKEEITPELIEVKKETLKTKRLIKTIQQKLN